MLTRRGVAELSWQIYQHYQTAEIVHGRRAIEVVSHSEPIPQSGLEFGDRYIKKPQGKEKQLPQIGGKKVSEGVRSILRFYHQIGILLDKGLIDPDFVFPLIGSGLETSEHGIRVAVEFYQNYYGAVEGYIKIEKPRSVYSYATKIVEQYKKWQAKQK